MLTLSDDEKNKRDKALQVKAREMYAQGITRERIAARLVRSKAWVEHALVGLEHNYARRLATHKHKLANGTKQLMNPWLDPLDEANVEGYKVPSPEEIAERAAKIRELNERNGVVRDDNIKNASIKLKVCARCHRAVDSRRIRKRRCDTCNKQILAKQRRDDQEGQACRAS